MDVFVCKSNFAFSLNTWVQTGIFLLYSNTSGFTHKLFVVLSSGTWLLWRQSVYRNRVKRGNDASKYLRNDMCLSKLTTDINDREKKKASVRTICLSLPSNASKVILQEMT